MRTNNYYQELYRRKNPFKELFLTVFLGLSSAPRLLLEVFIRKNFGERYFSFALAIVLIIVLSILPFSFGLIHPVSYFSEQDSHPFWSVIGKNILWYLYLVLFFFKCLQRRKEIIVSKSSFDFGKFSLYNGDINPSYQQIKIKNKYINVRQVETAIEPLLFFVIGFVLILFQQSVGFLILICSIIYSLSYCAAYYIGDNVILDTIDQMICNEELFAFFVEGKDSRDTRGFRPYGRRPKDRGNRQKVADDFFDDDDDAEDTDFEEVP